MKHFITSLALILLILIGAFFFEHQIYLQEKEKIEKIKMSEIEINISMTSSILTYIFSNLVSDIDLAAVSLGNYTKNLTRDDYTSIFNSIEDKEPLFKELSYINNTFTPVYSYPKLSNENLFDSRNFLLKYLKKFPRNNTVILPQQQNTISDRKQTSIEETIAIEHPIVNANQQKNGFILGNVNIKDLAALIKLDTYFKNKDELEYYLVNTKDDSILGTPNRKQKNNVFYKLIKKNFSKIETTLFQSKAVNRCIITKLNGKKVYIAGKKLNVADKSLAIIGISPYRVMTSFSKDFIQKSSYILIYLIVILIVIVIILVNFVKEIRSLKKQVKLKIEFDRKPVIAEEAEITESDYFKELQNKLEKMKKE